MRYTVTRRLDLDECAASAGYDFFFFSSRRRHTRLQGDWSSDVCSSDLRLEAVGTLASGIAHDFNNLLMGLAGLAKQALRALPADHPAAALVQRSLESTERGGALTRQLMMFSGQRRAQARPVELDAACRAARELLDRMVGEHIHVTMETGAPGLGGMAEPWEIEQILLNLATNSRDAMPGGGELVVRTRAEGSWG